MPVSLSAPAAKVTKKPLVAPPGVAVRAVLALRKALLRAADAVVPPHFAVFERVVGGGVCQLVGELARLKVADLLVERPLTGPEIAERTGTNPDAMTRAMRAAVAVGLFARDPSGRFENNRLSAALRSGDVDSCRSFAEYFASRSNMHAWADFGATLQTGKNAFERVHGKSVWQWFDEHPHERETFAHAMMSFTLLDAPGVAAAYPFGELRRLCDVGGGRGTLLSEILIRHPDLRGVLCDAEGVLSSAEEFLSQRGVRERVELASGSFFEAVPKGCDAVMMKNILHDWDDARSTLILRNCRAAMERGNKMLIVESLVEADSEDIGAISDLQMMVVCGEGRERGRADFERLFAASGFRLGRVFETPTPVAVIEGIAI
jgi:O-methyltransferase